MSKRVKSISARQGDLVNVEDVKVPVNVEVKDVANGLVDTSEVLP